MTDNSVVLEARQLTKRYGDITALDNFTLSVQRGNILGVIGPNGAGKTTLIRILVGQARPTSGAAAIDGCDCSRDAQKIKHLVGYMPDVFGSYDNMRVGEYLDFFGAAFNIPPVKRRARVAEVMETTGATYMRDRFVESLSHGMKQRVAVARTLLHDPSVLILDEPANGLDPHARIEMRELLLRLAEMGKTLIVTSHILPELSRICDQVAIITSGQLRAFGSLDEIMRMVHQQRMFEFQLINADQIDAVSQTIGQQVDDALEIVGSAAEQTVRFRTSQSDEDLSVLLAKLIGNGVQVGQFREIPFDLEDTFLSITGKDT
jgi:ABC-2 type transport system ATP-binding protein